MDPQTIGTYAGGAVLTIITAVQTIRAGAAKRAAEDAKRVALETTSTATANASNMQSAAQADLVKSNADLASAYKLQAEEWKALAEKIRQELADYREWVHTKTQKDNQAILNLTEENARLRAQTDLTPLLEHMKRYDANAEKVAATLDGLVEVIRQLSEHVSGTKATAHDTAEG